MTTLDLPTVTAVEKYTPQPWQVRDLNYLSPMPYSANWSQMGCYKTSTVLWLLQKKRVRNALIVTTKLGKGAYFSDFFKCLPTTWNLYNLNIHTIERLDVDGSSLGFESIDDLLWLIKSGKHNDPIVILTHYDALTTAANKSSRKRNDGGPGILDKLQKIEWDFILADEAHRLKNPKTQWTGNIKKLKAKNRHAMTGTGFVNNPAEIWSILDFLKTPHARNGYWPFRTYFCEEFIHPGGFRIIKGLWKHKVEEFRKMRQDLGPRHTMATVHKGITKPIETTHRVDLNSTQRRMYDEIKAVLQTLDEAGALLQSPNVLSQLNRLRQISVATPEVLSRSFDANQNRMVTEIKLTEPSAKLDVVMDLLKELDDDQKVVIFSNFKDPLELLKVRLEGKYEYIHMQQKHTEQQRYQLWHDEFRKPDKRVFLSTLALGGESINLSCAEYLIFLDRSWSPKDMMQAVGRVYRPGQTGAVEVIHINARNTVDTYVKQKLDVKEGWFNEIFGD